MKRKDVVCGIADELGLVEPPRYGPHNNSEPGKKIEFKASPISVSKIKT